MSPELSQTVLGGWTVQPFSLTLKLEMKLKQKMKLHDRPRLNNQSS